MGYILIELDTTGPRVEIHAPSYTNKSAKTPINIVANESLASYQEIYIMDAEGVRHDLTFLHSDNEFVGEMYFNDYPLGVTTIYARVKDTVDNMSNLASFSFYIRESEILTLDMSVEVMANQMNISTMNIEMNTQTMKNEMSVIT
jgi:hypothetical protein